MTAALTAALEVPSFAQAERCAFLAGLARERDQQLAAAALVCRILDRLPALPDVRAVYARTVQAADKIGPRTDVLPAVPRPASRDLTRIGSFGSEVTAALPPPRTRAARRGCRRWFSGRRGDGRAYREVVVR